jgi:hypothetical protein
MSTKKTLPSSRAESCVGCQFDPCACSYIAKLRLDGELAHLREAAIENFALPLPHRPACPCPRCYSLRLASWNTSS